MTTSYSTLYKSLIQASKKSHFNKGTWALMASALACFPAVAAETELTTQDNMPVAYFPKITVTATRTPTAVNNTIAQTRVIDSEDLKRYQGQTALDVIKNQPGFSYYSNGGTGSVSNFYVRGYDNKSILVLIDGIRYSSLSAGGAALGLLPADQVDRIEVLYGASGSSIYGADAVGGVIQIFTKGANVDESSFSVTAGAGSNDQYQYGATAQFRNDQGTSLSLSASHNKTDGFDATSSSTNLDNDGFESDNYSLAINQQLNPNLRVGLSGLYSESEIEFDSGSTEAYTDQKNGAAQVYADWNYNTDSSLKLSYGQSMDKGKTTSANPSIYDTKQQQVNLVGSHGLSKGQLVYGAEHLKQELDSDKYEADDRKVTSGFLGYIVSQDNFDAQANLRYDDYSDFDSETTYNLGAAYRFTPELRVGANYAKGYRVPTFNDLYGSSGNPDLKPETSDNYEAFVEYITSTQSTRLTVYYNKVDELIAWQNVPTPEDVWAGINKNIEKAKIEGLTLTSDWIIDDYLFGLSYDYQKAKDDSGGFNDGKYLPIRPKHKGLLYVGYQFTGVDLRAEYQYIDDYYNFAGHSGKIDSYNLVNISGNYQLSPNLSMSARLNNVFNEKYETSQGYNTDGTNFLTSFTYTWK